MLHQWRWLLQESKKDEIWWFKKGQVSINAQDFAIVRAMVFLGSVLYIIGLLLTDISPGNSEI